MLSVSGSTSLEDVATLCPHAANLINPDTTQGQMVSSADASTVTSGHRLYAHREQDCLNVQDESHHDSGKNNESELINREVMADQMNWIRPDLPSRCTWGLGAPISESPHSRPER